MSDNLAARTAWVQRVLDLTPQSVVSAAKAPGQDGPTRPNVGPLVAYRQALLRYEAARRDVHTQIEAFSANIATTLPQEADFADTLAVVLAGFNERVGDAVDRAMSTAGDGRAAANKAAATTMRDVMAEIDGNPLVRHVDGNPFMAMSIAATLKEALGEVIGTIG